MEKPKASEAEGEVASLAKQSRALRMEAKPRPADDAPRSGHRAADNHEQSEANRTSATKRVKTKCISWKDMVNL